MIQNQLFSFFIYVIVGILLGFIFDIFRALRKSIKNSTVATNIEDILFVIISFIIIAMVFLSVSKYIITGETWILKSIIKILKSIYNFFIKFFKKINDLILKFLNKVKHK